MSSQAPAGTLDEPAENAHFLQAGAESVFAIHTSPVSASAGIGVVLAHSGVNNFSAHRNGVWTRISRCLAREGIPSVRFDFAGTGESSGTFVRGLAGQPLADETAAIDVLRATGCPRLLIVGSCFGSIPSVMASVGQDDVAGVILLTPPLVLPGRGTGGMSRRERIQGVINRQTLRTAATNSHYRRWFLARLKSLVMTKATVKLKRLKPLAPASRAAEPDVDANPGRGLLMETELAGLVMTGRHVEIVYGTADANLALIGADPEAMRAVRFLQEQRPVGLTWTVLDGAVHGLEDIAVQEQVVQLIVGRARELTGRVSTGEG